LPAAVQDAIAARAAGDPFFLEAWTRAVLEAEPVPDTLTVPDTIRDVILARIDHLPIAAKRLLHTAAVLGQSGPVRLLRALWEGPEELAALLDVLQQRAFLTVSARAEEPSYAFTQVLIQEVTYASLLPAQRHFLHVRAGQALENCYADCLANVCAQLAHHATRALASLADWPDADHETRRLALVLQVAQAWACLGRLADSRALLEQHQPHLESLQQPELAGCYYFRLGRIYNLIGDHARAAVCIRQALAAATRSGDTVTMEQAQDELARARLVTGPPRASLQQ
jgi:predicted ATPase